MYMNFVKVFACSSMETSQRFILKQVEGEENAFAVRKVRCTGLLAPNLDM